jgi:hypothetical protein
MCHLRVLEAPGMRTVTEYVCLVSPFTFDGRSFLFGGAGRLPVRSEALLALMQADVNKYAKGQDQTNRRAALACFSSCVVSIFSS